MATAGSLVLDSCDLSKPESDQLPKESSWEVLDLYQWKGFWYFPEHIERIKAFQSHFQSRNDDVILASSMKTGTTWLKALCYYIVHRRSSVDGKEEEDLLVKSNPHGYVLNFENVIYKDNSHPDLSGMPSPRLFHTHLPYNVLPDSIKNSECKIIYITRNPKDTLVSLWHFFNKILPPNQQPYPFEKAFDDFNNGVHLFGPFYDHALQYWMESLKVPQKIVFLTYEDLKRDPKGQVKNLAAFLGRPFLNEAEADRVIWRCSLERLKNLEVNKTGAGCWEHDLVVPFSSFFRHGAVGDWKNYFTPEMQQRLDEITRKKLEGSGLDLEM